MSYVEEYMTVAEKSSLTSFMFERIKFQALPIPNSSSVMIIGGIRKDNAQRTDSIAIYDSKQRTLNESSCKLSAPKCNFGATIHKDKLFLVGGSDSKSILNTT